MFAQNKSSAGPRRTGYNRPVPTRLRMGLVMRRDMAFGELGDVEGALRAEGVGLAPISTGDASLIAGGVTVLATATAKDIAEERLKGLVVPGGSMDEASLAAVRSLIDLARANGLTVIAFADGVALAADSFGVSANAEGAVFKDGGVTLLNERAELSKLVGAIV
ncbi:hypothetical protein [Brevundimonas sp. KM4]|uniref:hypothetical protein n=1 Tax=Brevundimonas sp. KM4 TaxID=1628191 RepID=UPI000AF03294|nr:hypothetical protein [Brevundimonas sp. KM4]